MLKTVNRVLLGIIGLALVAGGLGVLAGGLDLPGRWGAAPPAGWPWQGPDDVVLSEADRTRWREESWWWPVVIGGPALVVPLSLWWLLAQLRRPRLAQVLVDSGEGEGALVRGRALEEVLTAEAESLPGVERSRIRLWGRRTQPRVRVGLLLGPDAEPGTTVERLRAETLEHARVSAGLRKLPAEVRLGRVRDRPERVS